MPSILISSLVFPRSSLTPSLLDGPVLIFPHLFFSFKQGLCCRVGVSLFGGDKLRVSGAAGEGGEIDNDQPDGVTHNTTCFAAAGSFAGES